MRMLILRATEKDYESQHCVYSSLILKPFSAESLAPDLKPTRFSFLQFENRCHRLIPQALTEPIQLGTYTYQHLRLCDAEYSAVLRLSGLPGQLY
jgi:hypothetical protein